MRLVFLGTGDIGLPTLRALIASEHAVVGVVTQPDKPVGRKQILTPPEVKTLAESHGIPVTQPKRVRKPEALAVLEAWAADVMVVMAYGQILPKALLEMPKLACLNLHASLLPRHRGAAPIQAAIRDGDTHSGMTVMHVAEGLDTGDIFLQHPFELAPNETGQSLHDRLAESGPAAILEALQAIANDDVRRVPQDDALATHTGKLTREDGLLDWKQPAQMLERLIRAYDPWPGTYTLYGDAKRRLKVFPFPSVLPTLATNDEPGTVCRLEDGKWGVQTGDGGLLLGDVQLEGKKRMPMEAFALGQQLREPFRFGTT